MDSYLSLSINTTVQYNNTTNICHVKYILVLIDNDKHEFNYGG